MKKKAIICVSTRLCPETMLCVQNAGYKVTAVDDAEEGVALLGQRKYDLVVYQPPNLPNMAHCITVIRNSSNGAILALVESASYEDALPYLELADDAILAPINTMELTIRARALKKHPRAPWHHRLSDEMSLVYGRLCIFPTAKKATYNKKPLQLTPTEYRILHLLACNAGAVISRLEIYGAVWGTKEHYNFDMEKNINNHISNMRKKLKKHTNHEYILAAPGEGYFFAPEKDGSID